MVKASRLVIQLVISQTYNLAIKNVMHNQVVNRSDMVLINNAGYIKIAQTNYRRTSIAVKHLT